MENILEVNAIRKEYNGFVLNERKSILFSTHVTSDLEKIADYITFIHKGELVFSIEKDEIFEKYGMVKGGEELLSEENRGFFTGYSKGKFGVEALTADLPTVRNRFKEESSVVVERAALEDIMFYTGKGKSERHG